MKATLSPIRSGYHLRIAWTTFSFAVLLTVPSIADNFAALVSDRTAVERVYYDHRLGTKLPFEQALPTAEVERLVKIDLHKATILRASLARSQNQLSLIASCAVVSKTTTGSTACSETKWKPPAKKFSQCSEKRIPGKPF